MTIRIIKRGSKHKIQYPAICDKCGTEFTFEADDAELKFDQRDGNYFRIHCPECRADVNRSQKL